LLKRALDGDAVDIVPENVDEWKPLLEDFYAQVGGSRKRLQDTIMNHYLTTENARSPERVVITERCAAEAYFVFCDEADFGKATMERYLDLSLQTLPDVYLHLRCTPQRALAQIQGRVQANGGDEKITLEYLEHLDRRYGKLVEWLAEQGTLVVDVLCDPVTVDERGVAAEGFLYSLEANGKSVEAKEAFKYPVTFAESGTLSEFRLGCCPGMPDI
jgi:deoxyadenosine/deoxycytidine kinase